MKNSRTQTEIDSFLSGLVSEPDSLEKKAYSAYFIKTYRKDIDSFLRLKQSLSGKAADKTWAVNMRKNIARYSRGPKGYYYNPHKGSLESASKTESLKLSPTVQYSCTFATQDRTLRLVGYAIIIALALFLTWGAFEVVSTFKGLIKAGFRNYLSPF